MSEKAIRLEILKYYYTLYKKSHSAQAECEDFTEKFGIAHDELEGHIKYLDEKGLIRCVFSLYGLGLCKITAKGIDALENPEQLASEVPFSNLVIHGDVINSQILQAENIRIENGFNRVYGAIENSNLDEENKKELLNDVKEIESEGSKKKPDIEKIKTLLDKAKRISSPIYELLTPLIQDCIKRYFGLDS